jgi:hypothetical protein
MPELDDVALWAVVKDPADRLSTAAGFAGGIEDAIAGLGGVMSPEEIAERMAVAYGDVIEDRGELDVAMSNEELKRRAGCSRPPEARTGARASGSKDTWPAVEVDAGGANSLEDLDEALDWVDVETHAEGGEDW